VKCATSGVVVLPGPPTVVQIDFFVQTFGPLNEVEMVSQQAAAYQFSLIYSLLFSFYLQLTHGCLQMDLASIELQPFSIVSLMLYQ